MPCRRREIRRHLIQREISDTGCGMTADTAAQIFEPFFTTRPEIGEDTSNLFNLLTSCTAPATWKKLIVAPLGLHERVLALGGS